MGTFNINGLTDREYDYYKIQSTKCDEYRKSILGLENKKIDEISTPTQDNTSNLRLTDKKALYLAGRKDPGSAGFFHFLLPSAGHAYVGDWGKGIPFILLSGVGYLIISNSTSEVWKDPPGRYNAGYYTETNQSQANIGTIALLTSFIGGIASANKAAKQHNIELYKSIYGTDMPMGFDAMVMNKKTQTQKKAESTKPSKPPVFKVPK